MSPAGWLSWFSEARPGLLIVFDTSLFLPRQPRVGGSAGGSVLIPVSRPGTLSWSCVRGGQLTG